MKTKLLFNYQYQSTNGENSVQNIIFQEWLHDENHNVY